MKSVRIRRFYGPYFPEFGLNTVIYGVSPRIQSKCGKIQTRKTPNTDTFHAVGAEQFSWLKEFYFSLFLNIFVWHRN